MRPRIFWTLLRKFNPGLLQRLERKGADPTSPTLHFLRLEAGSLYRLTRVVFIKLDNQIDFLSPDAPVLVCLGTSRTQSITLH